MASALARATSATVPDALEVLRPDRRHERGGRLRDRAQLGDLPEPAHPHLRHEDAGLRLEPQDGERQPELVVPARLRGHGRRHRVAERRERVLRRRLPGGADDGDHLRFRALPHAPSEGCESSLLVTGHERGGTARERVLDEALARVERDEEIARTSGPRVVVHSAYDSVRRRSTQLAELELLDLAPRQRDQRAPRSSC